MQRQKTLRFWDDFYESSSPSEAKEWIVRPSEGLLRSIADCLPQRRRSSCSGENTKGGEPRRITVLEIGCGNSRFALRFWQHLRSTNVENVDVVATDVSDSCVERNNQRDRDVVSRALSGEGGGSSSFRYDVLDALARRPSSTGVDAAPDGEHEIVLDKGCLDTFLYRTGKQKSAQYSPVVTVLLNNVHRWLRAGGKYVVISPRSKIIEIRDFNGFSSVKRVALHSENAHIGDLDGATAESKEFVYMYVCFKKDDYSENDRAFRNHIEVPRDDDLCSTCGTTFLEFRKGEDMAGRGHKYWGRRWQGHVTHCK